MKKKELGSFILIGFVAAIFAFIVSGLVFKASAHTATATDAPAITSSFPDTNHDPNYTSIFSSQALDPTRPVSVGSSSNNQPFNSSSQ